MSKPEKPAPVGELQARLRHMAEHWALYQADGIDARLPLESTHPSAIEARKWTALARAATTQLEAAEYIQDALLHMKDFELFDAAVKGEKYSKEQSNRRKGKGTLTPSEKRHIQDGYKRLVECGERYGAIRELAAAYRVSESTIKTILKAAK